MKAQKIGFVMGLNVAAACLMMQGCKATKAVDDTDTAGQAVVVEQQQASAKQKKSYRFFEKKNAYDKAQPTAVAKVEQPVYVAPVAVTPSVSEPIAPSATVKPISATPAPVVQPKTTVVAAVPAVAAPAAASHTVQKGDTLSGISKHYNVKMSAILAANPGLQADKIRVGKKINIPGTGAAAVAAVPAAPEKKSAPTMMATAVAPVPAADAANLKAPTKMKPAFKPYDGATKEYVVKNGDSLGKIASENGLSIRALKELNGLKKDMVRVGQKIKIPSEKVVAAKAPVAAVKSEVKVEAAAPAKVEAPAPVKEASKAAVAAPVAAPAPVAVEQPAAPAPAPAVEAAPAKVEEAPAAVAEPVKDEAPVAGATHVVKDGEDLVSIAIQYAVSPSALMELNNLKVTDTPKAGQVLKLPASATKSAQ